MTKTKSPILLRIISLILLSLWMGLIFYLSSQNAESSSDLSGGLIEYAVKLFSPDISPSKMSAVIESLQFIVRKTAHFTAYGILGILSFIAIITYETIPLTVRSLISLLISIIYSVSDEYHQTFVKGRSGELRDILIDSAGALLGIIFSLIIYKIYKAIKRKRSHKMKKKQYMELTDTLSQRLNFEKQRTSELREENSALNRELLELKGRIIALEKSMTPSPVAETVTEDTAEEIYEENSIVKEPLLSDSITDGAKIIGKIVLSSAKYCNALTGISAPVNAKELVNLILGRTEVAKAEILRLTSLDIDPRERMAAMEKELSAAEDYFKSVMAQKN